MHKLTKTLKAATHVGVNLIRLYLCGDALHLVMNKQVCILTTIKPMAKTWC